MNCRGSVWINQRRGWGRLEIDSSQRAVSRTQSRNNAACDGVAVRSVWNLDGNQVREQTQGRMKIRVGTAGEREAYSTSNVMASNAGEYSKRFEYERRLKGNRKDTRGDTRSRFWIFKMGSSRTSQDGLCVDE